MSLACVPPAFEECPSCRVKPGSPTLCPACLERRELRAVLEVLWRRTDLPADLVTALRLCRFCAGVPAPLCQEHGR